MENQIADLLAKMAAQLGVTVQYLWQITVRQAHYNSIINVIEDLIGIAFIIFTVFFTRMIHRNINVGVEQIYYNDDGSICGKHMERWEDFWYLPVVVTWVVSFIIVIGITFSIDGIITGFVNPEYWAFNHILSALTGSSCSK